MTIESQPVIYILPRLRRLITYDIAFQCVLDRQSRPSSLQIAYYMIVVIVLFRKQQPSLRWLFLLWN